MNFSLDDTLVNNALQTLNKNRPAMVDVIPTDGIVPLYINPQGVAKLLRNETLTSLPKNLEPVFYNAFDDMLSRLDSALRSESGEVLAAAIRTRFPVAMIDEFQDTDPQQYRIFRRIWHHQPETALLLIGDPKQAIYACHDRSVIFLQLNHNVAALRAVTMGVFYQVSQ